MLLVVLCDKKLSNLNNYWTPLDLPLKNQLKAVAYDKSGSKLKTELFFKEKEN